MTGAPVVVCGGGVIGVATAFFLAESGVRTTIVERNGIAGAASGKAGGFLARDWCDGSALGPLARRSFALHAELADRFDNPWDYRGLDTFAAVASARRRLGGSPHGYDWLAADCLVQEQLGTPTTTAQVHPEMFARGLWARSAGVDVISEVVVGLRRQGSRVTAVLTEAGEIDAAAVVLALGPWTSVAAGWVNVPSVSGLKGASVVLENQRQLPAHALFAHVETLEETIAAPEIFNRPDGTTYVCGIGDEMPVLADPADVAPIAGAEADLRGMLEPLAPGLARAPARTLQACYRPVTNDGLPRIGALPGVEGVYIATGHGVWGVLNAPATGEALAALILGNAPLIDLAAFDPARG